MIKSFNKFIYGGIMKKSLFTLLAALCLFSARVMAKNCVENNSLNCTQLGYTEPSCPYGGVACPFDTTKWHCAKWSCEDGRYVDAPNPQKECMEVSYKGLSCYACSNENSCPAYTEDDLVQYIGNTECPTVRVMNDIDISSHTFTMGEGQVLKSDVNKSFTLNIKLAADLEDNSAIFTTANNSMIENLSINTQADKRFGSIMTISGTSTLQDISISVDGKDDDNYPDSGLSAINLSAGSNLKLLGNVKLDMKNLIRYQIAAVNNANNANITTDSLAITQKDNNSQIIYGLFGQVTSGGNISVDQIGNSSVTRLWGVGGINKNIQTSDEKAKIIITQTDNVFSIQMSSLLAPVLTGVYGATAEYPQIKVYQDFNSGGSDRSISSYSMGIFLRSSSSVNEIEVSQNSNTLNSMYLYGIYSNQLESDMLTVTQSNNINNYPYGVIWTYGFSDFNAKIKDALVMQNSNSQTAKGGSSYMYGIYSHDSANIEKAAVIQASNDVSGLGNLWIYGIAGGNYEDVEISQTSITSKSQTGTTTDPRLYAVYTDTTAGDLYIKNTANITQEQFSKASEHQCIAYTKPNGALNAGLHINTATVTRTCGTVECNPDPVYITSLQDNYTPCK